MENIAQSICRMINEHLSLVNDIKEAILPKIETAADWFVETLKHGGKVLFAGNGGSAADAQHLAAELIGLQKRASCVAWNCIDH